MSRRSSKGRLVGVDLGSRRIGIAISDSGRTTATPYTVIDRSSDERDAAAVAEIARAEDADEVVLGMPLRLDGTKGDAAFVVEGFGLRLKEAGLRVRFWDERMTTAQAEKGLRATGMKGPKRRQVVDKVAASVILQSYLDAQR